MTIAAVLENAMKAHVETNHGLICGPQRLLTRQIGALREWLRAEADAYEEQEMWDEAGAIKDLMAQLD